MIPKLNKDNRVKKLTVINGDEVLSILLHIFSYLKILVKFLNKHKITPKPL